jgi:hypothetical protein
VATRWNSTLLLDTVAFDDRAHRLVPMALGNLVRGKWQVAGWYDAAAHQFATKTAVGVVTLVEPAWPKTNRSAAHTHTRVHTMCP